MTGPAGTEQPTACDWRRYERAVRDYLAYCKLAAAELEAAGSSLDPKSHPTADGAVKMIPHRGDPAAKIRQAVGKVTRSELTPNARSEPEAELDIS